MRWLHRPLHGRNLALCKRATGVMDNPHKKIQFGGWKGRRFAEVRAKVNRFLDNDERDFLPHVKYKKEYNRMAQFYDKGESEFEDDKELEETVADDELDSELESFEEEEEKPEKGDD